MKIFDFGAKQDLETVPIQRNLPENFSESDLEDFLISWISEQLGMKPSDIKPETRFVEFGVDSIMSVKLSGEIERLTGIATPSEIAWQFPTVRSLSSFILELKRDDS